MPIEPKRWIKTQLRRRGYELRRFDPAASSPARRLEAIRRGRVSLVVDVGANVGQYASDLRMFGYRGRIVSLEPLTEPFAELASRAAGDPAWDVMRVAAGAAPGRLTMRVSANFVSSSFLEATPLHVASEPGASPGGREEVQVQRLDDAVGGLAAPDDRLMLKLDLQGFELPAIDGAVGLLPAVQVIELELSLAPMYAEQPLLPEAMRRVMDLGFRCVGFDEAHTDPDTGHVLQVDGLFIRDP
jgi:FkbM family methyltransferase